MLAQKPIPDNVIFSSIHHSLAIEQSRIELQSVFEGLLCAIIAFSGISACQFNASQV